MLHIARFDGMSWDIDTIEDEYRTIRSLSVAVDFYGVPHLAYFASNPDSFHLRYAYHDGSEWIRKTVKSWRITMNGGAQVSLALDSSGSPHISYSIGGYAGEGVDYSSHYYTHRFDAEWHTEYIGGGINGGTWTSLALDSEGSPHICLTDGDRPDTYLKYMYRDGSSWFDERVSSHADGGDLELDPNDHPHVAYYLSNDENSVIHAYRVDSRWHRETVARGVDVWSLPRLAICPDGTPHVSYSAIDVYPYTSPWHAYEDAFSWHGERVGSQGRFTSIAVDGDELPHIGYLDNSTATLKYTYATGLRPLSPELLNLAVIGPCPSRNEVAVAFRLGTSQHACVSVFDVMGRRIITLEEGLILADTYRILWNGFDERGLNVPSGTFIVSAEADGERLSRRIVIIR